MKQAYRKNALDARFPKYPQTWEIHYNLVYSNTCIGIPISHPLNGCGSDVARNVRAAEPINRTKERAETDVQYTPEQEEMTLQTPYEPPVRMGVLLVQNI